MGVYIPNMEKPKSCGECKFFSGLGYGFHCYLNGKHITFIGEIEDICPLIEIDLVRCGECRYYNPLDEDRPFSCEYDGREVNKTDFCSYGERRDDETNSRLLADM